MCKILTEPGVAKIRRFGLGIVLNWEMLAELIKVGLFREKKTPGIFCAKKKKKKKKKKEEEEECS